MNYPSPTATLLGPALLALMLCAAGAALAVDQQSLYTQSLAATCANCHGTQCNGVSDACVSGLAVLYAFKSGERQATIMHQLSKGYSEEQIRLLAAYFASQKP